MNCGNNCHNESIFGVKTPGFHLLNAAYFYFEVFIPLFPHWLVSAKIHFPYMFFSFC